MSIIDDLREAIVGPELAELRQELGYARANLELAEERLLAEAIPELQLAIEDRQWITLNKQLADFDRGHLGQIWDLSRLMYLKNPLINRGVLTQTYYVWAQGINIEARSELVDDVIQEFMDDSGNRAELTSHQARTLKEVDLQVYGNVFLVLFTDRTDGFVRVRSIPCSEIMEIICDPDDRRSIWFYKRQWQQMVFNPNSGQIVDQSKTAYYPDWHYQATDKPAEINGHPVMWDAPICHLKRGGMSDMLFGVPETFQAIDWARAYKSFLEDWSTIVKAYSRFAWTVSTPGKAGVAAVKSRFASTLGSGDYETNPPPVTGAMWVAQEDYKLDPVRTAGATTKADDARRLLLMVCAAMGLPETFFGDVSVGTLATARSLDRPTELKFLDCQAYYIDFYSDLFSYVIDVAQAANKLPYQDPETDEDLDENVSITFPPILEHDVNESVGAIVSAATLDGKAQAGTIPDMKLLSRMLLTVLGAQDIDELMERMFPEDEAQTEESQTFVRAVQELREALVRITP